MRTASKGAILLLGILLMSGLACGVGGEENATPTPTPVTTLLPSRAYAIDGMYLENMIWVYKDHISDELPVVNGSVIIDGQECQIIDLVKIYLTTGNYEEWVIFWGFSQSCISLNGSNNDNCDSGFDKWVTCDPEAHYIWAVCEDEWIKSTCVGDDCLANNERGFQGVYP